MNTSFVLFTVNIKFDETSNQTTNNQTYKNNFILTNYAVNTTKIVSQN